MNRFWVDAWDPSYAAEIADDGGPTEPGPARVDPDVELPADAWAAVPPPPDVRAPDTVLLVDGVRRTDARLWTAEPDGSSYPGIAASYAAGTVRCDLRRGVAELAACVVERGLFTASPTAADVDRYPVRRVAAGEPPDAVAGGEAQAPDLAQLLQAVQGPLATLEVRAATAARVDSGDPGDLLVVDGPLRGRTELPRAIGYVKTHRRQYLAPRLVSVVTGLPARHRSPVFQLSTSWQRYTWYLRLPGGSGGPWSGLVRVECAADLTATAAVALADLSAVTLPRFAATAYKDPRAPQNLVPIGGLEHRLRARLGDARLLHRALTRAATRP